MANAQAAKGDWNQFKGKIQEKWGAITDDDLDRLRGQRDQLIGLIQEKTGVAKEEIGKYVSSLSESASDYAHQAMDTAREYGDVAAERAQLGYEEAQRVVREKPAQSLAVCFGVGVLVGVVSGLVLSSR